jgi:hypothetical protein
MNALDKGEPEMTARYLGRSMVAFLLGLGLVASGCATATRGSAEAPAASVAAQPSSLAGTWHGSSYPVGAHSRNYGARLTVTFQGDGTWKAVETRATTTRKFSGTSVIQGDQVFLTESTGHYYVTLTHKGDRLYGPHSSSPDFSFPSPMAIELTRAE